MQDEIDRTIDHRVMDPAVLISLTFVLFVLAVANYFFPSSPRTLVLVTALYFGGALVWGLPRYFRARTKIKHLRQGRDGERAVAEYLDLLRDDGYRVLHDLQGEGFNVDHVIIGPQGVYTIETKTISKPVRGNPTIHYDGSQVRIGAFTPDRNPVTQAAAQASWLRRVLAESTGKTFTVQPVVVFPGWFVEGPKNGSAKVWVIEPKMLQGRLRDQPTFMNASDISLCVFHLKRLLRE